jgi:hypothetical protein
MQELVRFVFEAVNSQLGAQLGVFSSLMGISAILFTASKNNFLPLLPPSHLTVTG